MTKVISRVFFTRPLAEKLLHKFYHVHIRHEYLLKFETLDFAVNDKPQWIFFSSGKAVKYFYEGICDQSLVEHSKIACMGSGTAKELRVFNKNASFIGSGTPTEVANQFSTFADGVTLFPMAENSLMSIQLQLKKLKLKCKNLPVYKSLIKSDLNLPKCEIIACTSPLSAQAVCENYHFDNHPFFLAIGESTAEKLKTFNMENIHICETPNITSLVEKSLEIIDEHHF